MGVVVRLVSGEELTVMNQSEATWFEKTRDAYLAQTKFTEVTDEQDVDRLMILELSYFRFSLWCASGLDYDQDEIDSGKLTAELRALSKEINAIKATMGLTKAARDTAASDGDFSKWFENAKLRAKAFNFHRVAQLQKCLALFNEFSSIVATYDRCDEEERQKTGFTSPNQILDWWRKKARPEYDELDRHFRESSQSLWVREM